MKHKITYQFTDISFGYEGEEEVYVAERTKYFNSDSKMLNFISEASKMDSTFSVKKHIAVSYAESNFWYTVAKIMNLLGFYRFNAGTRMFYYAIRKSLTDVMYDDLCCVFDNKGYKARGQENV